MIFAASLTALPAAAGDVSDAWITMKTTVLLMTTERLYTVGLDVNTVRGVVTLHGKVATDLERELAAVVATQVRGVRDVMNLLQVVPTATRQVVNATDADIKRSIQTAFDSVPAIRTSGVYVASVNAGVVLLSGKTSSMEAHLEAVRAARRIEGVRRVATEVEVALPAA